MEPSRQPTWSSTHGGRRQNPRPGQKFYSTLSLQPLHRSPPCAPGGNLPWVGKELYNGAPGTDPPASKSSWPELQLGEDRTGLPGRSRARLPGSAASTRADPGWPPWALLRHICCQHLERGTRAWTVAGALGGHCGFALALLESVGGRPQTQDLPTAQALTPFVEHGKLQRREAVSAAAGLGTLGIRDVRTAARGQACWSGAGRGTMLSASPLSAAAPGARPPGGRARPAAPTFTGGVTSAPTAPPCDSGALVGRSLKPTGHRPFTSEGPAGGRQASAKAHLHSRAGLGHTWPSSRASPPPSGAQLGRALTHLSRGEGPHSLHSRHPHGAILVEGQDTGHWVKRGALGGTRPGLAVCGLPQVSGPRKEGAPGGRGRGRGSERAARLGHRKHTHYQDPPRIRS